jgi:GAF domain-containing protein
VRTGKVLSAANVEDEPLFDPSVDARDGRTPRSLLSVPVTDSQGNVFAVVELTRGEAGRPFGPPDERIVGELTTSLALLLESWWRMSCTCRAAGVGRTPPCCSPWRPAPVAPA